MPGRAGDRNVRVLHQLPGPPPQGRAGDQLRGDDRCALGRRARLGGPRLDGALGSSSRRGTAASREGDVVLDIMDQVPRFTLTAGRDR